MIFYRRNTISDKCLSFMGMMFAVTLIYNSYQRFRLLGTVSGLDLIVACFSIALGILFLMTWKFKYLEITDTYVVRYNYFVLRQVIPREEIEDITMKQKYFIITRKKGADLWISKFYIKNEDDEAVSQAFKKLIGA